MRRWLAAIACACVVMPLGVALASHPGSFAGYVLLGFTADGKYAYFRKEVEQTLLEEHWLAVYDATTAKPKTSQPVFRDCGKGGRCDRGQPISKKVGERTIAKLHAAHGAPSDKTMLAPRTALTWEAGIKEVKKGRLEQVFTGDGVEVVAVSKLRGKLPDPNNEPPAIIFDLELTVTAGASRWTAKHVLRATTVDNADNGNNQEWPGLYVEALALAPDRRAAAFVFATKPHVVKLAAAPAAPPVPAAPPAAPRP